MSKPRFSQILIGIGCFVSVQMYFSSRRGGEAWLREACAAENKRWAGQIFSGEVRCDRAFAGPGMKLTLEYTAFKRDASEFPAGAEATLKQGMLADTGFREALAPYIERGVLVEYNLYSRDRKLIMHFTR